jgi:hypothetical protein
MDGNAPWAGTRILYVGLVSFYSCPLSHAHFSRSTRNIRIERLWVEVGTQFARRWRAFFTRVGRLHHLDRKNLSHLWLLHCLFLPALNNDCKEFQNEWNLHPISGRLTNDQSPAVSHPRVSHLLD